MTRLNESKKPFKLLIRVTETLGDSLTEDTKSSLLASMAEVYVARQQYSEAKTAISPLIEILERKVPSLDPGLSRRLSRQSRDIAF